MLRVERDVGGARQHRYRVRDRDVSDRLTATGHQHEVIASHLRLRIGGDMMSIPLDQNTESQRFVSRLVLLEDCFV